MDRVFDESDPDNDLAQTIHAYQTAESVLKRYFEDRDPMRLKADIPLEQFFGAKEWDELPEHARKRYAGKTLATHFPHIKDWSWFPLAALIHDLGKVCTEEGFRSSDKILPEFTFNLVDLLENVEIFCSGHLEI